MFAFVHTNICYVDVILVIEIHYDNPIPTNAARNGVAAVVPLAIVLQNSLLNLQISLFKG